MLSSITPFGERGRGTHWSITVTAFAVGSIGAGALFGAATGALGSLLPSGLEWRRATLLGLVVLTVLLDASSPSVRLPTWRRQVNEDWLERYRGWVYGSAFGAQLGVGLATIVTSATTYCMVLAALLSERPAAGAAIGATFGAVRALPLLTTRSAQDQESLTVLHRRLIALDAPVRRATQMAEVLVLGAMIAWAA